MRWQRFTFAVHCCSGPTLQVRRRSAATRRHPAGPCAYSGPRPCHDLLTRWRQHGAGPVSGGSGGQGVRVSADSSERNTSATRISRPNLSRLWSPPLTPAARGAHTVQKLYLTVEMCPDNGCMAPHGLDHSPPFLSWFFTTKSCLLVNVQGSTLSSPWQDSLVAFSQTLRRKADQSLNFALSDAGHDASSTLNRNCAGGQC